MLDTPRQRIALSLSLTVLTGLGALGYYERDKLFPPKPPAAATEAETGGLNIPTIEEMCKALGATSGDELSKCQQDEHDAGEFVIAWMGYNNFMVDGQINVSQIQLLADLGQSAATSGLGVDPSSLGFDLSGGGLDPSAAPSFGGDTSGLGGQITAGIDPVTGQPQGFLQSPAELALYCLQMASDWVTMHDCISENDPSSHLAGGGP